MEIREIIREILFESYGIFGQSAAMQKNLDKERPFVRFGGLGDHSQEVTDEFNDNIDRDLHGCGMVSFDDDNSWNRLPSMNRGLFAEDDSINEFFPNLASIEGEASSDKPKMAINPNENKFNQVLAQLKELSS